LDLAQLRPWHVDHAVELHGASLVGLSARRYAAREEMATAHEVGWRANPGRAAWRPVNPKYGISYPDHWRC
jgi:hypothetical protein